MISDRLLKIVRCPDCRGQLKGEPGRLVCEVCARRFTEGAADYLVLRPSSAYGETTKFVEDSFHADGRDESVSPPLLSAAVRNNMLRGFLRRLGLANISVDYVVVDPLRVPRDTFAAIWKAWRDGYADTVSTHTPISHEMFLAHFEDMIATIEDPDGYGVWHVPVIAAQVA